MAQPVVIVFDVFGSVVDWRGSLIAELTSFGRERGVNADWTALVDAWRAAFVAHGASVCRFVASRHSPGRRGPDYGRTAAGAQALVARGSGTTLLTSEAAGLAAGSERCLLRRRRGARLRPAGARVRRAPGRLVEGTVLPGGTQRGSVYSTVRGEEGDMADEISIQFTRFSAFYSPLIATIAGGFLKDEGFAPKHSVAPAGESAIEGTQRIQDCRDKSCTNRNKGKTGRRALHQRRRARRHAIRAHSAQTPP